MSPYITIREYEANDKNDVINLLRLNTPTYFATTEEADLNHYLDKEREMYYVMLNKEKIIGCGGINFDVTKTIGKISWDILHPTYQEKGLGSLLLKHRLEKLTTTYDLKKIIVRTSQLAYTFYQKHGFIIIHVVKNYWSKGFDLYEMEYNGTNNKNSCIEKIIS